jgi:hypothetical protein
MYVPGGIQTYFAWAIFALCAAGAVWFVFQVVTIAKEPPGTGMPGMWRLTGLPGYQGATKGS